MTSPTKVAWDLSDLFSGPDDPAIDARLDQQETRAIEFARKYRGKIRRDELTPEELLDAIREYESIAQEMAKPYNYAGLVFAADTSKFEHGALFQRVQERVSRISLNLVFFQLELMAARPQVIERVAASPLLEGYRHFIHASRLFRRHRLSEDRERILEEKANTGGRAFERLFEESVSAIEYRVRLNGKTRVMTEAEVIALLRDPSRETRKAAAAALTRGLKEHGRLLTFIFNTLVLDKSIDDRLRRYDYPEQARNLGNELDKETVETVIATCVENYPLVARYYRTKREILGYDKLTHYDRYAPLFESKKKYPFEEARDVVLKSFETFSNVIGRAAREFFDNGWIDAEPRKGKRGGAFCMYVTPDLHPYVFLNHLDRLDDVMTMGHELGHGVHAYLARGQSFLNFSSALPVAELASTFGEMLVFDSLAAESDLQDKLALYAHKIEEVFATIFRQASMYRFEQQLHGARRERGELSSDEIGGMWQRSIQEMFGDSVELGEDHRCWWMYVNHFVSTPFYVYAYSFGELLVMALYSMYRREGEQFVCKYLELLRAGGSCSPQELLSRVGIDIGDPEFWRGGMSVVERMIADFEQLYAQWRSANATRAT